ncbi:hypothetical protein [Sphingomonas sp.]|uniref:hypothetical protein n=1 Tax=Sphingomonas sp. TaxID=28214 RepID=UPI003B0089B1
MDDEQEPTAWQETGGVVPQPASALPATQWSSSSLALPTNTDPTSDTPDNRRAFAETIGPCLALTAPSGMGKEDRRNWLAAAFASLRHLPLDVIEAGCREAARVADHPSKIVPAVIAATEADMAWRKRNSVPRLSAPSAPALPAPGDERPTSDELDAICKRFAVGRYATAQPQRDPARPVAQPAHADPQRPCRAPTRDDYLRLGVDPSVLESLIASGEQREAA